jgi:UDP-2,3-diacylglucosamine hydrolase
MRLLDHYLDNYASRINKLYILGDLFEVWVGDDAITAEINSTLNKLKALAVNGCQIYFCHGNRDFLVGQHFAELYHIELLEEYSTISLADKKIVLCHGDTLCTDDITYQEFRSMVRTNQWQTEFLHKSVDQRLQLVNQYRQQSKSATKQKAAEIMDVNDNTVLSVMQAFNSKILLHGHTHRPAVHQMKQGLRVVLSDWRDVGHFLRYDSSKNEAPWQSYYFSRDELTLDKSFQQLNTDS